MKLITKNTDYAVRALVHLANHPGGVIPASRIALEENIPEKFLRRLLRELIKKGYLVSKEGKGGGVALNKNPKDIRVIELMKIFQGDFQISQCMFRKDICPNRKSCVLRSKVREIEKGLEKKFGEISISSLFNAKEN
jgi:Rrf2 family transcriptional regulator, cysteine metabolism repressor